MPASATSRTKPRAAVRQARLMKPSPAKRNARPATGAPSATKARRTAVAAKSTATSRPQLTHVAIHVWDLPRMAAFYEGVLGLIRSDEGRGANYPVDFIFLTADPTEHHQFVLVTGRPKDAGAGLVNQLSFRVGALAEVRATYQRAKGAGVEKFRVISHGNAWSIYFHDPEGNQIEVYTPTPWYIPQPHGDAFDLESMSDAQIYRWTEQLCRQDPKFQTRTQWVRATRAKLATRAGG